MFSGEKQELEVRARATTASQPDCLRLRIARRRHQGGHLIGAVRDRRTGGATMTDPIAPAAVSNAILAASCVPFSSRMPGPSLNKENPSDSKS